MSIVGDGLAWLADPANWAGSDGIPVRLAQHLAVTAISLAVAALIALPLGVAVGHARRGQAVTVALAGAARAIPTLGLLTLLGLWLGIGANAPVIAFVVLAIPSLLAGSAAAVAGVDRATVDASRAIGMTGWQLVTRVELPLAAPVIVGAIRAATLQVVATATLAAYTADLGLGRYLFTGLKSRDYAEMLGGAVLVTVLALGLEAVLATWHRAMIRRSTPHTSPTSTRHPRSRRDRQMKGTR